MGRAGRIARRTLLVGSAAIAGGVAFGVYAYRRPVANPLEGTLDEGASTLNPYVVIDAEGVTLVTPRADVGQGATSIQAYLLAEELDLDPLTVRTAQGPASGAYWNGKFAAKGLPFASWNAGLAARAARTGGAVAGKFLGLHLTGGSTTVPDSYDRLRAAGASAREKLKEAAARRLGIDRARLRMEGGAVIGPAGAPLTCAELAGGAAALEPIAAEPRDPSEWKHRGKPMLRTDIVAKSTGTQLYGGDMRLDGMLHATVITNPILGGGMASFNATVALNLRGVRDVLEITDGLAVLADNDWRASKAVRALLIDWGDVARIPATTEALWHAPADAFVEADRDSRLADDGDVEAALAEDTAVAAEYRAPFLHHAPMEPANATILHTQERTDVWAAT